MNHIVIYIIINNLGGIKMKRTLSIALCLLLAIALVACGGDSSPAQDSQQADDAQKEIAVLFPGDVGYFNAVKEGFERGAAEFNIKITYVDAGWDAATQVSQIEDAIQRNVDLIAVCCADALAFQNAVPDINAAGIPVIAFTNGIGTDPTGFFPGLVTYVGQNEIDTGRIVGEYAVQLLGEAGGKVVRIEGVPGTTPQINRRAGFEEGIASNPNIEIVFTQTSNWSKEEAIRIVEDLIQANTEMHLIYAQDAGSAIGASMALQEAGLRDQVYILAIDGSIEALAAVKDGTIDATTWMSAKDEGYYTMKAAHDFFNGVDVPSVTQLYQVLVTKDNVDQFEGQF